jgi:D-sedoheptulose 7-phosphate isomerase
MSSADRIARYFETFAALLRNAEASGADGGPIPLADAFGRLSSRAKAAHAAGNKLMFIGNGGSAGIASHMAIDYSKNGGLRSQAFNDGAALTCLGYDQVFAKQIEMHGRPGDVNLYIASHEYGFVEIGHAALCHAVLDLSIIGDG